MERTQVVCRTIYEFYSTGVQLLDSFFFLSFICDWISRLVFFWEHLCFVVVKCSYYFGFKINICIYTPVMWYFYSIEVILLFHNDNLQYKRYLMAAFKAFWNSPVGPKTTHFWGPVANWGFVAAVSFTRMIIFLCC
jgi:hypothetical protein